MNMMFASMLLAAQPTVAAPPVVIQPPVLMPPAPPAPPPPMATTIQGKSILVYNMLDIRRDEYTPKVLAELDRQVGDYLTSAGVKHQTVHFRETSAGRYFTDTATSAVIPMDYIIRSQLPREREMGADFRLVIFPAKFELIGAWRYYTISFIIEDRWGRLVMDSDYSGKHLVMWKNSENSVARGRKITNALVEALYAKKLVEKGLPAELASAK